MRHVLAGVLFFVLACSLLWAALPFTDAFTNTNGTLLTAHSANYTNGLNTISIQSNAIGCTGVVECGAKVNSETFADDQYAKGVFKTPYNNYFMGVQTRMGTGDTGYNCMCDTDECYLRRRNSGFTNLDSGTSLTIADGYTVELQSVGSSHTCVIKNGGTTIDTLTGTDSTFTSGAAGVGGYNQVTTATTRIDDFEAGNVSAGGSAPIRRRPIMMFFTLPELP